MLNGVIKVATDGGAPALDFKWNSTNRASWTIPVPSDWDGVSNITVTAVWAPSSNASGNVTWRLEYLGRQLTQLASAAVSTIDYTQAAGGTLDSIQTTGTHLVIPAGQVSTSDEMLIVNLVRMGSAGTDTYHDLAQVYLVKYSYKAKNIV